MRTFYVDTIPGGQQTCIQCNQFERGDEWRFQLFYGGGRYTIPVGSNVMLTGTKADKAAFEVSATIIDNTAIITVTEQMTAAAGRCIAELMVVDGSTVLYSANFIVMVEPAAIQGELADSDIPQTIVDVNGNVYIESGYALDSISFAFVVDDEGNATVVRADLTNGNEVSY